MNNIFASFNDFKVTFANDIEVKLVQSGIKADVQERNVQKLNESYTGLTVTPEGSNIGMNLCLDRFYNAIENGTSYEEVMEEAMKIVQKALNECPIVDISEMTDYEKMKKNLVVQVVSAERNAEMLKDVPHTLIEDLAVVYRFIINRDEIGMASILVTNQILETMGVSPAQLKADAMEYAPKNKPVEIKGLIELMIEMMGREQAMMMGLVPSDNPSEQILVATVPDKVQGAGVIAYPGFFEQAAERTHGDFYLLPSSLHEVLMVPDIGKMGYRVLADMVQDVNNTQVAPEDKLSDTVYHYSVKDKVFETGQKWLARTNCEEALA